MYVFFSSLLDSFTDFADDFASFKILIMLCNNE